MIEVTRTFTVDRPLDQVREYLRDFSHATAWDPGTQECEQTSPGPVAVGTTWRNVSEFKGKDTELTYRLESEDAGALHFVGENKTATSHDDIELADKGAQTEVKYTARIEFHGLAKLASPFLQSEFERLGNETERQMTTVIAGL